MVSIIKINTLKQDIHLKMLIKFVLITIISTVFICAEEMFVAELVSSDVLSAVNIEMLFVLAFFILKCL